MVFITSILIACVPQNYTDDWDDDTGFDYSEQDTSNSNNDTGGNDTDTNTLECQEGDSDCNGIVDLYESIISLTAHDNYSFREVNFCGINEDHQIVCIYDLHAVLNQESNTEGYTVITDGSFTSVSRLLNWSWYNGVSPREFRPWLVATTTEQSSNTTYHGDPDGNPWKLSRGKQHRISSNAGAENTSIEGQLTLDWNNNVLIWDAFGNRKDGDWATQKFRQIDSFKKGSSYISGGPAYIAGVTTGGFAKIYKNETEMLLPSDVSNKQVKQVVHSTAGNTNDVDELFAVLTVDNELIAWTDDLTQNGPGIISESGFTQISDSGLSFFNDTPVICGVREDTSLSCLELSWNTNEYEYRWNLIETPSGSFQHIVMEGEHACAVRQDNAVLCWNINAPTQAKEVPGFKSIGFPEVDEPVDDTGNGNDNSSGTNCEYEIYTFDTYGDGWDGAVLDISINGEYYSEIECPIGEYEAYFTIPVEDGGTLEWSFSSGQYDNEIYYAVLDNTGALIFEDGDGDDTTNITPSVGSSSMTVVCQ